MATKTLTVTDMKLGSSMELDTRRTTTMITSGEDNKFDINRLDFRNPEFNLGLEKSFRDAFAAFGKSSSASKLGSKTSQATKTVVYIAASFNGRVLYKRGVCEESKGRDGYVHCGSTNNVKPVSRHGHVRHRQHCSPDRQRNDIDAQRRRKLSDLVSDDVGMGKRYKQERDHTTVERNRKSGLANCDYRAIKRQTCDRRGRNNSDPLTVESKSQTQKIRPSGRHGAIHAVDGKHTRQSSHSDIKPVSAPSRVSVKRRNSDPLAIDNKSQRRSRSSGRDGVYALDGKRTQRSSRSITAVSSYGKKEGNEGIVMQGTQTNTRTMRGQTSDQHGSNIKPVLASSRVSDRRSNSDPVTTGSKVQRQSKATSCDDGAIRSVVDNKPTLEPISHHCVTALSAFEKKGGCNEDIVRVHDDTEQAKTRELRCEWLKRRFGDTILRAEQKQQPWVPLNKGAMEEKIKEAQIVMEAERKLQIEKQRDKARIAVAKIQKTVEFEDNVSTMEYLAELIGDEQVYLGCTHHVLGDFGLALRP